ncbi:MAG: tetratricopeptide repeat protein [Bacteroidales bacterium]|nr:tetratricopeptide repeat protein [Bacteroidales bacterium]
MASLVPGYKYDIFISYRQKDNKHDGWVTEFVNQLKGELEATFKEDISIYFDENPHDGLLETHDVNASLKDKLKCLVFIPIISRTYCDPKSFAWEHEFKAFVELASQDQFGLKVKLPNGNVASRVLPVRIHDLDNDDIKLCESVLGGVLRSIEFIYKSPGVNRPLRSDEESPNDNLNKTFYRDQINKVALAIKEIILGLKSEPAEQITEKPERREPAGRAGKEKADTEKEKPYKWTRKKLLSAAAIIAILVFAAILVYPKLFKKSTLERLRTSNGKISVAVMPFQNLTNDTIWNIWQVGIQNELITSLTNSEELKIRQIETVNSLLRSKGLTNYASILQSDASTISQRLDANVLICGSINQAGSTIRLNAQLINPKTEDTFKAFQLDGTEENILYLIDSLSVMVKNSLIISKLANELPLYQQQRPPTTSPEAYRYYLYGENARSKRDYTTAIKMFSQALAIDSNFILMTLRLSVACINEGLWDEARKWSLIAYSKRDQMPIWMKIISNINHAGLFETPFEKLKYMREYLEIDNQFPGTYYDMGLTYNELYQYDKAIPEFEKSLELYNKFGTKPWWAFNYTLLGEAYHETGQYKKEKKLYRKADKDFPNDPKIIWRKAILFLTERDTLIANKYIDQYVSIYRHNLWSESALARNLGLAYSQVAMYDKAEEYFRRAINLDPGNGIWNYYLAWHLIDKDRNIDEGLKLIDKALESSPEYEWLFLDCKGWGLYKQGKYAEALEVLEKCRDMSPYYQHDVYLHLEEVKKAIAGQKNN